MQHREDQFKGARNQQIHYQLWLPDWEPRGLILVVHGAAEHSGRYRRFAEHFLQQGYATAALDHIGHGRSDGRRGHVDRFSDYIETLDRFVRLMKDEFRGLPVILLGHSMGGLISTCYLLQNQQDFAGCVLSGPAIKTDLEPPLWQRLLIQFFALVAPRMGVLQLDANGVSRDPLEVKEYLDDPLVYGGKLSARKVSELFAAMNWVQEQAADIKLPILLMHGEADVLTAPSGSRFLFEHVSSEDKTLKLYPGLYHEIFNEPERGQVFDDLQAWLDERLDRRAEPPAAETSAVESPSADAPGAQGEKTEGTMGTGRGEGGLTGMSEQTLLQVKRDDIRSTRIHKETQPALAEGQVRVAIDKFALTANNVTYAVAGDMIGYWDFYPGEDGWGHVPVWGLGDVVESAHPGIPVGERLYGFFPMATHTVLTVGEPAAQHLTDISEHRRELPATYNIYRRTSAEREALQQMEDQRCLLFPLFATSYLLYDYLVDNELFGAGQILLGSASSKTAFGLASLLSADDKVGAEIVGITSAGNREFVEGLGIFDKVICYGEEAGLDAAVSAAYVDMSGDAGLTTRIHEHFRDQLKESCAVGATHWESFGETPELPGPKPEFFFAPAQIAKRDAEWGPGVVLGRATEAVVDVARQVSDRLKIEHINDAEAAAGAWCDLVDNKISPDRGLIASLKA